MVILDTNVLIALAEGTVTPRIRTALHRTVDDEVITTTATAWFEFSCGPVEPERLVAVRELLTATVLPVGEPEADLAAHLFNRTGRRPSSKADCQIAASTMLRGGRLLTEDRGFRRFVAHGLALAM
jgi:predicted nucleic acid-binding protein